MRSHPADWVSLSDAHQHRVLDDLIESLEYDHRSEQLTIRLRQQLANSSGEHSFLVSFSKDPSGRRQIRPSSNDNPKPLPRITRLLALAFHFEKLLREGTVRNYPDLARRVGISVSRVSQILKLRNLAPSIQERILAWSGEDRYLSEFAVRRVSEEFDWGRQLVLFEQLLERPTPVFAHNDA